MRMHLVSNDIMSAVSKSNKCETCQQKIIILLTNGRQLLIDNYFYIHMSLIY